MVACSPEVESFDEDLPLESETRYGCGGTWAAEDQQCSSSHTMMIREVKPGMDVGETRYGCG